MTDARDPIFRITDEARTAVIDARAEEAGAESVAPDDLGLFVEITGLAGTSFSYDIYFQAVTDVAAADVVERHDGLAVIVAAKSVDNLRGATLDVDTEGGLVIVNPNSPSPAVGAAKGAAPPAASPLTPAADATPRPLLTITEAAREIVLGARDDEPEPDKLALWLEISGVSGGQFTYDMYFQATDDAQPADAIEEPAGITIVVPADSVDRLRGSTLDVSTTGSGMVIINPHSPTPPAADPNRPQADLSGEIPQRVLRILEEQINPSIAAHGGRAELVAVEDDTAYLRLGGGCQGCGLAKVTLSEGIAVAIQREVPEIVNVVDVTDHGAGDNPYYEPSKK